MKRSIILALLFGSFISGGLLALDHFSGSDLVWMDWEMPGIAAAYLFWGAVGSSVFMGMAICWFVNAIIYSAPALAIILLTKWMARLFSKRRLAS